MAQLNHILNLEQSSKIYQFLLIFAQLTPKQAQHQQTSLYTHYRGSVLGTIKVTTKVTAHRPLQLKLGHQDKLQPEILHFIDE